MRLSVFSPENSSQLLIDLAKIYQSCLTESQLTPEALQALIENEQAQLYVTLFNERHLGAVQVETNGNQAQLGLLAVREITRRRGVGKNLLNEVEKQLKHISVQDVTMQLDKIPEPEKNGLILFMQACGYQLNSGILSKKL